MPKMNKTAYISVRDNRKTDFTKGFCMFQYSQLKFSESMYN